MSDILSRRILTTNLAVINLRMSVLRFSSSHSFEKFKLSIELSERYLQKLYSLASHQQFTSFIFNFDVLWNFSASYFICFRRVSGENASFLTYSSSVFAFSCLKTWTNCFKGDKWCSLSWWTIFVTFVLLITFPMTELYTLHKITCIITM